MTHANATPLQQKAAKAYDPEINGMWLSGMPLLDLGDTLFVFVVLEAGDATDTDEFGSMMVRAADQLERMSCLDA